ncbi:IclR family transcriptional regulator [soil metagenome]
MASAESSKNVKSAQRVLEVLEHFAEFHEPVNVSDIAAHLGYPQSSTSMLLTSLVSLGYLSYDSATRRYSPTLRVLLLGAWMQEEVLGFGALPFAMDRLRKRNELAVMIGIRQDLQVRYMLSLRRSKKVPPGNLRPICRSAIGKMLLCVESDEMVERIARRANAETPDDHARVDVPAFVDEIRATRERGWAECRDFPVRGLGGLAVRLTGYEGHPPMALGVGMSMARLEARRHDIVATLHDEANKLTLDPQDREN